jgi:hypothetical protein
MEYIFKHETLDDQTFIKEINPIRYRAGKAHLVSDHQHGEGSKKYHPYKTLQKNHTYRGGLN